MINTMFKTLATVTVAVATVTAQAWGDREQGILLGLAAATVVQQTIRPMPQQIHPYQTMPPVISHRGTYHPIIVSPTIDPRVYRPQMELPVQPVQYVCPIYDHLGRLLGHGWCR